MTEQRHTPGEWTYQANEIWGDGLIVAFLPFPSDLGNVKDTIAANAQHIVTACNAHDGLVAACEQAEQAVGEHIAASDELGTRVSQADCDLLTKLRAALALAGVTP